MNCLPRIIAPTHLAIFSFFYPLPVKLKIEYQQKHGFCYIFSMIVYMHFTFSTIPWILPLKITKSAWHFEIALYISTPRPPSPRLVDSLSTSSLFSQHIFSGMVFLSSFLFSALKARNSRCCTILYKTFRQGLALNLLLVLLCHQKRATFIQEIFS